MGGLFSFDGGGYTGSGPRTGGVDGKGGFPAILHPNETVIDHTRTAANQNAKIEVVLSPDLEARILAAAQNQSVQIVRQAAPGIVKQSVAATGQTLATKPGFGS